jgi:DNA-binding NtrC family response regulator
MRRGPFVHVDGFRDRRALSPVLETWLSAAGPDSGPDPLKAAEHGTLFLDSVECLPRSTQEMLLTLLRRRDSSWAEEQTWVGRLVVGNERVLSAAVAERRFSAALYDLLDKVRVELEPFARSCA